MHARHAVRERSPRRHGRARRDRSGARADDAAPRLDHAGIEALIPHRGPMCLLDRMTSWDATRIECVASTTATARHPLRSASGLLASAAIEYAAQAMAVHGALCAAAAGDRAAPGFWPARATSASPAGASTTCRTPIATSSSSSPSARPADAARILYAFVLRHDGRELASGRVAVVLDAARGAAR